MSLLDRLAIFAVPILAGALTAIVLLGPGAERPALGARAHARLAVGADRCALRLQLVHHERGRLSPREEPSLELELAESGRLLGRWQGSSDGAGYAEAVVELAAPARGPLEVRISAAGTLLARGAIELSAPLPIATVAPLVELGGPPRLALTLPRRALVAELPEQLEAVAQIAAADPDPELRVEARGADATVRAEARRCQGEVCSRRWTVALTPRAPLVELSVEVHVAGQLRGRWEGQLPVQIGRIWLDPAAVDRGELSLRASSAHDAAYLSLVGPLGRFWGGSVPMKIDQHGRAQARLPLPSLPAGAITALISSDASEGSGSTIAWPLRPALGLVEDGSLRPVADGLPAAIAAEERRRQRARWPAFGLILSAGVFELVYLGQRRRRAGRRLRAHLAESGATDRPGRDGLIAREPWVWLVLLAGGVLLAFFVLAAVAAWA